MGPRKHGRHRSKEDVQQNSNKAKHTKSLKNKIRDVQRLLKKSDLPATIRVVQERMLDVLKETIKDKAKEDKERRILKRSKKVKFFEKRKVFRKYKACVKELNETKDNKTQETLEKELEEIKRHWNYVVHFPQDTKYISLFPLTPYTNEKVVEKQEQILELISEKVASGELEDASATIDQMGSGSKERKTARPKLRLTEQADVPQGDSGDESEEQGPSPKLNLNDDFFMDSSASTGSLVDEEKSKKEKKKPTPKLKRPKFKIQKS
ncbi:rRNA-processing protein efg1-like [Orbicella faveolata]|uniref:rRNA-processing protein efg1-like n=1 Tax=Orbicella faveolata TaxID=48498 RepID=UPI0009E4A7F3|nr:rRNA-processing protein efg1-like [Orbicella faveolata]